MLASRFSSVRSPASNLKQKLQKVVRKPTDYVCPFKRQKGAETILLSFKLKAEVILQWFNDFASEFQQEFNKQQAKKSKELQLDSSVHDLQKPCGATYCPLGNESNQPTTDECLTARSSTPENGESEEDATNRTRRKKIDEMRQQLQRWMIYALLNEDHLVDLDTRTRLRNAAHAKMSSQDPEEKCGDEDALSLSFLLTHMMQSMEPSIEPLDTLLEMSQVARGDMGFEQWVKTIVPMERLLRNYGLEFNEDNIQISKSARQHTHTMRIEEGMLWSRLTKRERIWVEENTEDSWNLQEVNGLLQDRDKRNKVEQFYDPVEVKKLDDKYALAMKSRPKHNTLAPTPKDPKPKCSNCHRRHHGKCTKPKADSKKQDEKKASATQGKDKPARVEYDPCSYCQKKHKGGADSCYSNPANRKPGNKKSARTATAKKFNLQADKATAAVREQLKLLNGEQFTSIVEKDSVTPSIYDKLHDASETNVPGTREDVYEVLSNIPVEIPGVGSARAAVDTMSNVNCVSSDVAKRMETLSPAMANHLMDPELQDFAKDPPSALSTGNGKKSLGKMLFTAVTHAGRRIVIPVFSTKTEDMPSNTDILLSLHASRKLFTPKKLAEIAVGDLLDNLPSQSLDGLGGRGQ